MKMVRQGDLLLVKTDKPNKQGNKTESKDIVLLEGEATGHAHRVKCAVAMALVTMAAKRYLELQQEARLTHEEHTEIILEPGCYEVVRQREWTAGDVRYVLD